MSTHYFTSLNTLPPLLMERCNESRLYALYLAPHTLLSKPHPQRPPSRRTLPVADEGGADQRQDPKPNAHTVTTDQEQVPCACRAKSQQFPRSFKDVYLNGKAVIRIWPWDVQCIGTTKANSRTVSSDQAQVARRSEGRGLKIG